MQTDAVRKQVHAALERESRINLHRHRVRIETADGTVTLEGEVADVAAKKLALQLAAAVRDSAARLLLERAELRNCSLSMRTNIKIDVLRLVLEADPELDAGQIHTDCNGKVVFLDGAVPNEHQKRRAELDAWSLSAIRGVVNRLEIAS